jgi:hypothetical protein
LTKPARLRLCGFSPVLQLKIIAKLGALQMKRIISIVGSATLLGAASGTCCAASLTDVPGRWQLHKVAPGPCVLSFSGAPDMPRGTVAAMGFCPQMFIGLPRWRLDAGRVVISDRHRRYLVELAVGRDRLHGHTVGGEEILLER